MRSYVEDARDRGERDVPLMLGDAEVACDVVKDRPNYHSHLHSLSENQTRLLEGAQCTTANAERSRIR